MTRLEELVLDLELHAAGTGWDAAPRLFALVGAPELHEHEPELAQQLDVPNVPGRIAALEQPALPAGRPIDEILGGIQQKMVAARAAGATVFLTPAQNCGDAVATAPKGLRLIRADTMHGALQALTALRTGQGSIPACPAR